MKIHSLHPNFVLPVRGSDHAAGYDLVMPTDGMLHGTIPFTYGLGFAAEVPVGYMAILVPRSSAGAKRGLSLRNTLGVIDSDYRGEWKACLQLKDGGELRWNAGDRLIQFILVPVILPQLELVRELSQSARGSGGFGSTGTGR